MPYPETLQLCDHPNAYCQTTLPSEQQACPRAFSRHFSISLPSSQRLPSARVYIAFQPPRDNTGHSMREPHVAQELVVPLLVEEKLVVSPQRWVHLAVLVEVRCMRPAAMVVMHKQHHAFSNVDEDAYIASAPVTLISALLKL